MSNNKQQTAVEWLVDQLFESGLDTTRFIPQIQQAKEMHKEEIINAWRKGDGVYDKVSKQMSVQYYEQTYGGNNE